MVRRGPSGGKSGLAEQFTPTQSRCMQPPLPSRADPASDPAGAGLAASESAAVERIVALADQCVLCGLCLPHCPTYALDRIEAESPRGRIMQFRAVATGALQPTPAALAHLDHCLACRNCEPVCPAKVRYGELLVEGRALLRRDRAPDWRERALEWLVSRPRAFGLLAAAARLGRGVLPRPLRDLAASLRRPYRRSARATAAGAPRGRVGLLTGCVGRHVQPAAVDAAVRVLTRLGWEVTIPPQQGCCGAIARHAGAPDAGLAAAADTLRTFSPPRLDHLLVLDSGCVESLRAGAGGIDVQELLAFVAADPQRDRLHVGQHAPERVALHLPCTQRNVTFGAAATRAVVEQSTGTQPELIGASGCCGAAGTQLLLDPDRAAQFRRPLLDAFLATGTATLATGNVGCRMHFEAGLRASAAGTGRRVVHPIELLAERLT